MSDDICRSCFYQRLEIDLCSWKVLHQCEMWLVFFCFKNANSPSFRRMSTHFPSSTRPSGMARHLSPRQQTTSAKQGCRRSPPHPKGTIHIHPHPSSFFFLFCKGLCDWSATPPANSHTVDWDLDLVCCFNLPSLPFFFFNPSQTSQSQFMLSQL